MSGYLEFNKGNSEFVEEGSFLQKPFSRDALVRKVDEVLGQRQAGARIAVVSLQQKGRAKARPYKACPACDHS
jgi:hypothetical protein